MRVADDRDDAGAPGEVVDAPLDAIPSSRVLRGAPVADAQAVQEVADDGAAQIVVLGEKTGGLVAVEGVHDLPPQPSFTPW